MACLKTLNLSNHAQGDEYQVVHNSLVEDWGTLSEIIVV
jgi:hypothetical protein